MNIKDIQEWEKDFSRRKGISNDYDKSLNIATLKLGEETGEVFKAILEKEWEDVLIECCDVLVFVCKIANIMEKFHNTKTFEQVISEKLNYCESRTYNTETNKMDKPEEKRKKQLH
ncbi:hypothetical protein GX888_02170 [Candidatus Dojkabacteria bacterium]|uniref:NTP pyrophosphohydrolase MazG-like domain-containing protein n=1 Tax=Candidatus Dojkabacteria bacterium TaxID=2099670 RepID=A0A847VDH1_9BACT|nr:hypothetical protein [Candidatus Dojkabacteria bacterium]